MAISSGVISLAAPAFGRRVLQQLAQLLGRGPLQHQAHAHAAAQRQQLLGAEALEQPPIAGEHHGEQHVLSRRADDSSRSSAEHGGQHLLGLVDDQHGPAQRGVDMALPALAQHLGAGPAVVRVQLDAEQVAHLAVEVGEAGLRAAEDADLHVALAPRPLGEHAQRDRLAHARAAPVTRAKPPSPTSCSTRQQNDSRRRADVERLDRHVGSERVPLQAIQRQQLLVHG